MARRPRGRIVSEREKELSPTTPRRVTVRDPKKDEKSCIPYFREFWRMAQNDLASLEGNYVVEKGYNPKYNPSRVCIGAYLTAMEQLRNADRKLDRFRITEAEKAIREVYIAMGRVTAWCERKR